MKTIDSLLYFVFLQSMSSKPPFSSRDNKTLQSLHSAMQADNYITEKQSNLLLQILNTVTYEQFMTQAADDYKDYLKQPLWKKPFRILPDVKRVYHIPAGSSLIPKIIPLQENYSGVIAIECTFSTAVRKALTPISDNIYQIKSGSFYLADFNEQNLVTIIDILASYEFNIDPTLQQYYDTITSWNKQDILDQYDVSSIPYPSFKKCITADIGDVIIVNDLIVNDRRLRYQYTTHRVLENTTLTSTIANRNSAKIWIDNSKHSINDVIKSLIELQRLPMLVVFDQSTDITTITQFNELTQALNSNGIDNNIGIYFRLDNTPDGKIFNDAIAKRQYNSMLTNDTQVAGVYGGKLPKFFLNEKWKPMSVLCINNTLRHSKTAVYAKCCDLIITYNHSEPMIETRSKWESN
jgi:hypothetical protein